VTDEYATIGAIVKVLGGAVALLTLSKAAWSVAAFFISMSATLKSLSVSVERLTVRFDNHYEDVHSGLSDVRDRLTALETWRDIH
jgi:hypothetical protein